MNHRILLQRGEVLGGLFHDYTGVNFSIRFWDGDEWTWNPGSNPAFTLVIRSSAALQSLLFRRNEITLGEAFVQGDLDIEGDIFSAFEMAKYVFARPLQALQSACAWAARTYFSLRQALRLGRMHSRGRDKASISFHYDQPVEFFRPWLGPTLAYSCAYFRSPDDPLDLAQTQKLELICRKLRLEPGEAFLDIGCGWGSLVLHAATQHHVRAQGITLSKSQYTVASERIAAARLGHACKVELRDYRDCTGLAGSFDKIASVGMYEHVGLPNLPAYFRAVQTLLKPGGVFLNHGIARSAVAPILPDSFIERHVFPDGRLVTLTQAVQAAEEAGFEVRDAENLREHYELTLRHWVEGLRAHADEVRHHASESACRIWLLYMAGCAAAFRRGDIGVYQLLLSRPERGQARLPLVREDWYTPEFDREEVST
ncbi:MAG TPA: class I SAM-dependent methyltransferase [Terracidiphilus sp.]|nr:class I SAM-dependent methyltransferase [Terracidiphilus sp.]